MKQKRFKALSIILIIMSFICIGSGFIMDYLNSTNFIIPSTILENDNIFGITVSTYNDAGIDGMSSSIDSNGNVIKNSDSNSTSFDDENLEFSDSNTIDNYPNAQSNTTNLTPFQINDTLRKEIQAAYGITIKYGNETLGYNVGGLSTLSISDAESINKALNDLKSSLANFPIGLWKEISEDGFPLTFYLIKSYSAANVTGITESYSDKANISIAINFPFEETFYHEIYHYLENYLISFKGANYNKWNSFNPTTFIYGNVNSSLSYTRTFEENSYFVNDYSQTEEGEDRASIFEYMMSTNKVSCLNNGRPVWKKARYMAEQLDYYLTSVSPNVIETWEKHL